MADKDFIEIAMSEDIEFDVYNIVDGTFDYTQRGIGAISASLKRNTKGKKLAEKLNDELLRTKVFGTENLKGIDGAIITCNHISRADGFVVWKAIGYDDMKVIVRENEIPSGEYGDFLMDIGYLPLGKNSTAIKNLAEAVKKYLQDGKKILMFPESNVDNTGEDGYKYVLENNGFRYAACNNVPVVPMYTMKKTDKNSKEYREIYILKPIYPDTNLNVRNNVENMRKENEIYWKQI